MPCAVMAHDDIQALAGLIESDPAILITLDLEGKVTAADMDFPATLPPHAKEALVQGKWDAIADLLESVDEIKNVASGLAYFKAA